MSDYMMELAHSHLNEADRLEVKFLAAPRRFRIDEESLDDVNDALTLMSRKSYDTMQDALDALASTLQEAIVVQQFDRGNGEWETIL